MDLKDNEKKRSKHTNLFSSTTPPHMYKSNRQGQFAGLETGRVVTFGEILTGRGHKGSYWSPETSHILIWFVVVTWY